MGFDNPDVHDGLGTNLRCTGKSRTYKFIIIGEMGHSVQLFHNGHGVVKIKELAKRELAKWAAPGKGEN